MHQQPCSLSQVMELPQREQVVFMREYWSLIQIEPQSSPSYIATEKHELWVVNVFFGTVRGFAIWDDVFTAMNANRACEAWKSGAGMPKVIRTFHNAKKEEVGRLTFEEKDERLHIQSSAPPGIDRRFRTERGAASWWESNVDPETGKIRR